MFPAVDQRNDANLQQLYSLLHMRDENGLLFRAPEFVKSASHDDIVGDDALPPTVFGDPKNLQFPCHNSAATWVSALLFHNQKQNYGEKAASVIEGRIDAAAKFYGITGEVNKIKSAVARRYKSACESLPDSDFALVIQWKDGRKERHFPLRNEKEVVVACDYLKKHAQDFTFDDRRKVAEKILKRAARLAVSLDDQDELFLLKKAGHGVCSSQSAAQVLYSRAKALKVLKKNPQLQAALAKTAMFLLQTGAKTISPSSLHKLASLVDRIDSSYGFTGSSVLPSIDDLFQINAKVASEVLENHIDLSNGSVYRKADLNGIKKKELTKVMGSDFAEAVSEGEDVSLDKLAEVASTLPRRDADLFEMVLRRSGISPVYRGPASKK